MAAERTRGAQHPLKLHARHHVGIPAIPQLRRQLRIVQRITRRQDHRTDAISSSPHRLLMIDRSRLADAHAEMTLRTDAAGQTPRRLPPAPPPRSAPAPPPENRAPAPEREPSGVAARGDKSTFPDGDDPPLSPRSVRSTTGSGASSRGVSRSTPRRYRSIESAPRLPSAIASINIPGPRWASPPARYPGRFVASVLLIDDKGPPSAHLQPMRRIQKGDLRRLRHRRDHRIRRDHKLRTGHRNRTPPAALVGLAQLHALTPDADYPAVPHLHRHRAR